MDSKDKNTSIEEARVVDSNPVQIDEILKEKLENAFHQETSHVSTHDIAKIAIENSPIDLAYAIIHLPLDARPVLYDNLPDFEAKVQFIINTDSDTRVRIFRFMNEKELKGLFENMPTDEAVFVLEDMSERRFRRVLELIDAKKTVKIKEQKKHERHSAGRLMSSDFFAFNMDITIQEACAHIRNNHAIDFAKGIYVLNSDKELVGFVPGRNLIINKPNLTLKQVMRPIHYKISPDATREEVVDIVERYKVSSLPVVDEKGHLVGVIANEEVVEVMEDLADATIAKIAGTGEKISIFDPILKRFGARSPWLVVTLMAGLVNVGIMSSFKKYEGGLLTFALFFVPLINGMSGNVGIQCSTVLVRSLAVGTISAKTYKDALFKELLIGGLLGLIFGVSLGLIVFFIDYITGIGGVGSPLGYGMIVGVGLFGACIAGSVLGVLAPMVFTRLGVDPAVSSGPIVTAFNDTISMAIYFLIACGLGFFFF